MDIASLLGLVLGFGMFMFGIISGGSAVGPFMDLSSFIITIGGSVAATMGSQKLPDFIAGIKAIVLTIKEPPVSDPAETIRTIIGFSNTARKEGLLALEQAADGIEDEFMKKGIMLVVDGTDPELVRAILEAELSSMEARHKKIIGGWEKWAEMGPAWGMIGTLVGLIIMLQNMEDASTIGPAMAVALITTLYGSLIANWLAGPTASKLKVNNDVEVQMKEIIVEGLLSIQAGENPRVIEEKLKTFLNPAARAAINENQGGGE